MPGTKRKYNSGRNYARQGGRARKRFRGVARLPRGLRSQRFGVHHFKRVFQGSEISINNVSAILGSLDFKFNQLPSYSDFTTLFDEYRINSIKVEFYPLNTSNDLNPASTALSLPNFHTIIDTDDSTTPADLNTLLQYPNHTMTRGTQRHSRYFRPCVAYQVYKTAIASGYGTKPKTWIDMENVDVPHYGLKWGFDGNYGTGSQTLVYKSFVTMYFSCKGVR